MYGKIVVQFGRFDVSSEWCLSKIEPDELRTLLGRIRAIETMTEAPAPSSHFAALCSIRRPDRRFVRRIAGETWQLAEGQSDGLAVAKLMTELVALLDAAEDGGTAQREVEGTVEQARDLLVDIGHRRAGWSPLPPVCSTVGTG